MMVATAREPQRRPMTSPCRQGKMRVGWEVLPTSRTSAEGLARSSRLPCYNTSKQGVLQVIGQVSDNLSVERAHQDSKHQHACGGWTAQTEKRTQQTAGTDAPSVMCSVSDQLAPPAAACVRHMPAALQQPCCCQGDIPAVALSLLQPAGTVAATAGAVAATAGTVAATASAVAATAGTHQR
jgi:hypothetical protein